MLSKPRRLKSTDHARKLRCRRGLYAGVNGALTGGGSSARLGDPNGSQDNIMMDGISAMIRQ